MYLPHKEVQYNLKVEEMHFRIQTKLLRFDNICMHRQVFESLY